MVPMLRTNGEDDQEVVLGARTNVGSGKSTRMKMTEDFERETGDQEDAVMTIRFITITSNKEDDL